MRGLNRNTNKSVWDYEFLLMTGNAIYMVGMVCSVIESYKSPV